MKKSISSFLLKPAIVMALLFVFLAACIKDYFDYNKLADTKWKPSLALPMVYTSLTIQDLLKKSKSEDLFQIGSDNFITLVYKGNLFSMRADEVITIPDNSFQQSIYPSPTATITLPADSIISVSSSYEIDFNSGDTIQIDSMGYKSGVFEINIISTLQHDIEILLSIPSAIKNGSSFSKLIAINNGASPVTTTIDLAGYMFDMNKNGNKNKFDLNYTITVKGSGNSVSTSDNVSLNGIFKSTRFSKIFGYIGQQFLSPDIDTVNISLFNNVEEVGMFSLKSAKIKAIISNSYGVPIEVYFDTIKGINPSTGVEVSLTGDGVQPGIYPSSAFWNLPFPLLSEIGQQKQDSFVLGNNAVIVINQQPKYFVYKLDSKSNPSGVSFPNFVLDSSTFKVDLEVEIPLEGSAVVFAVQDTVNFELPDAEQLDSLLLRVNISNQFPLDVGVQAYFMEEKIIASDTIYSVIDSVLSPYQYILSSPAIDVNGKAVGAKEKTVDQWLGAEKLKKMAKSKKLLIVGKMNTASTTNNGGNVKIYSDYKLDVQIGVVAKLKQGISFN